MKRFVARSVFSAAFLAVIVRLMVPIVSAVEGTWSQEDLQRLLSVSTCFLLGVALSAVGGFVLNFTDFARYTWPLTIALRRMAKRSRMVAAILRDGANRVLSPSTRKKTLCIVASMLAVSVVFSAYVESLSQQWNPIVASIVNCLSFVVGIGQGMVADVLLPRSQRRMTGSSERLRQVPQPMTQGEVESLYKSYLSKDGGLGTSEAYEAEIKRRGGKRFIASGAEREMIDFMKEEGFSVLREPERDHDKSTATGWVVFPPTRIFVITTEDVGQFLRQYEVFYGFVDNTKLLVSTSNPDITNMVRTLAVAGERISLVQDLTTAGHA